MEGTKTMRNKNLRKDFQSAQAPYHPRNVSSGGSGQKKSRAAAHASFWGKIRKRANNTKIKLREEANDNKQRGALLKLRTVSLAVAAFICGGVLGVNSSAIATQGVLRADERILVIAMDIRPEVLGRVLNAVNIGE